VSLAQPIRLDDEYSYPIHMTGAAHAVSGETDEECEAVRLLREVVAEVTGKPVQQQPKPRIGFLP